MLKATILRFMDTVRIVLEKEKKRNRFALLCKSGGKENSDFYTAFIFIWNAILRTRMTITRMETETRAVNPPGATFK